MHLERRLHRRDFLKIGGGALATVAMGPMIAACGEKAASKQQTNQPLKTEVPVLTTPFAQIPPTESSSQLVEPTPTEQIIDVQPTLTENSDGTKHFTSIFNPYEIDIPQGYHLSPVDGERVDRFVGPYSPDKTATILEIATQPAEPNKLLTDYLPYFEGGIINQQPTDWHDDTWAKPQVVALDGYISSKSNKDLLWPAARISGYLPNDFKDPLLVIRSIALADNKLWHFSIRFSSQGLAEPGSFAQQQEQAFFNALATTRFTFPS
jgi:hypothetical protein